MREDHRSRHIARLNEVQRRTAERHAAQKRRIDERFARARSRLMSDKSAPSDDQQRIVAAALALLDESGLQELSLRKLAAALDRKAPALYWHFKNKEALIDYMAEAILKEEFQDLVPRMSDEPWQAWLVKMCSRLRNAMRTHRDGGRVVAWAHPYPAVTLMRMFEVSMESLTSAGVELQRANLIITTATHFVFGNVIEEQASPSLEEIEEFRVNGFLGTSYPLVAKSIDLSLEAAKAGYDEFEDSLRLIIGYSDQPQQM